MNSTIPGTLDRQIGDIAFLNTEVSNSGTVLTAAGEVGHCSRDNFDAVVQTLRSGLSYSDVLAASIRGCNVRRVEVRGKYLMIATQKQLENLRKLLSPSVE